MAPRARAPLIWVLPRGGSRGRSSRVPTLAALALAALLWASGVHIASAVPGRMALVQVAPGDYVREGACAEADSGNLDGIANIGFVVGRAAVAVIDPGGSLADGRALRAAIAATTALPIRYVIMTHAHPDHVFGGSAFLADHPVFVGHWRLPASLANRAAYDHARLAAVLGEAATGDPVPPGLLVRDRATLDLGGRILEVLAQGTAHTDSDVVVLDHGTATLWAGDLLFVGRVPALDGNLVGWLRVLDRLAGMPAARAVPGHGPAAVAWPGGLDDERRYLTLLLADVRRDIAGGRDIRAVAATAGFGERRRWALFDDYAGRNATVAYKELQWE
jgi:quinoprotein relay system zinc metallohydrolase 2